MGKIDGGADGDDRALRRKCKSFVRLGCGDRMGRSPRQTRERAIEYVGVSESGRPGGDKTFRRRAGCIRQDVGRPPRERGCRLRHCVLPRCTARSAHLVRATVEQRDIEALTPWLDWAFAEAKATLSKAA